MDIPIPTPTLTLIPCDCGNMVTVSPAAVPALYANDHTLVTCCNRCLHFITIFYDHHQRRIHFNRLSNTHVVKTILRFQGTPLASALFHDYLVHLHVYG